LKEADQTVRADRVSNLHFTDQAVFNLALSAALSAAQMAALDILELEHEYRINKTIEPNVEQNYPDWSNRYHAIGLAYMLAIINGGQVVTYTMVPAVDRELFQALEIRLSIFAAEVIQSFITGHPIHPGAKVQLDLLAADLDKLTSTAARKDKSFKVSAAYRAIEEAFRQLVIARLASY
jgi:hypothetical protein